MWPVVGLQSTHVSSAPHMDQAFWSLVLAVNDGVWVESPVVEESPKDYVSCPKYHIREGVEPESVPRFLSFLSSY